MTGVIYARYSPGPRQTEQSIEGQVRDCQSYAREHHIEVVKIYADRHHTGKDFTGRIQYNMMMDAAHDHKFDTVIVWQIDRLGRKMTELVIAYDALQKEGVKLCSATECISDGPEGILMRALLMGNAEFFSVELRQKVMRGLRETALKGNHIGGRPPYGYCIKDKKLSIVPAEAENIHIVFDMWNAGATATEICDALGKRGAVSHRGTPIIPASIYQYLKCTHYIGYGIACGMTVENPRIVSDLDWAKAQDRKGMLKHGGAMNAKTDFLLSGKLVCGYCGSPIVGETGRSKNGKQYHYYKCGAAKKGKPCDLKSIPKDELEQEIFLKIKNEILTPENIRTIVDNIMDSQGSSEELKIENALKDKLAGIERQEKNLVRQISISGPCESITDLLNELSVEKAETEKDLAAQRLKSTFASRDMLEFEIERWTRGDSPAATKELLQGFIDRTVIWNDRIAVEYRFSDSFGGVRDQSSNCT